MKITKTQLQQIIKEAKMAEYGKIDAEDGNPPSKIGQGNPDYRKHIMQSLSPKAKIHFL